jgi:hypothetical protein
VCVKHAETMADVVRSSGSPGLTKGGGFVSFCGGSMVIAGFCYYLSG